MFNNTRDFKDIVVETLCKGTCALNGGTTTGGNSSDGIGIITVDPVLGTDSKATCSLMTRPFSPVSCPSLTAVVWIGTGSFGAAMKSGSESVESLSLLALVVTVSPYKCSESLLRAKCISTPEGVPIFVVPPSVSVTPSRFVISISAGFLVSGCEALWICVIVFVAFDFLDRYKITTKMTIKQHKTTAKAPTMTIHEKSENSKNAALSDPFTLGLLVFAV